MSIVPDQKNWTWVLERPCPECQLDVAQLAPGAIAEIVRDNAAVWQRLLARRRGVTVRPRPDRWSALEYGCHVRDVMRLYDERLRLMLAEDNPRYPNWDQDQTAVEARYDEQHPPTVAAELTDAAAALAARFAKVKGKQWQRTGERSDGARFTVESFGRYFVHDPLHHVHDVDRGFAQLAARYEG